jgi:hypothetical protein
MSASVQDRNDLVALEAGVARFGSRPPGHSVVAILDVVGADTLLATAQKSALALTDTPNQGGKQSATRLDRRPLVGYIVNQQVYQRGGLRGPA